MLSSRWLFINVCLYDVTAAACATVPALKSQPSVDAPFQSTHHSYGTHCHLTFNHLHLYLFSVNAWNISFWTIISWFCTVTLLRLCGLRNSSAILATLTNFDWHWHWHWHWRWCALQTFVYNNNLYFQLNPFTTPVQVTDNRGEKYLYNGIADWLYEGMLHILFIDFLLFLLVICCQFYSSIYEYFSLLC